LYIQWL
nr:Chain A, Peptide LYIQWL from Tc5b [synthetic construct]8ANH_A Chain A, Peptide LYIQWL from Tc5b [synthetic construct]8ANH_B Chain B, Peptide LYIQWL from Tc5b [synthetic construct]8ANI_A Chain A, Peptide LYIQWL from Tc5b [synthetic construct]8ANI_B Chain B, Peptide LYIQWL from Tc5b [synthetic construct]8ANM_A Chain A, Peptide LYIQWL from Tc5b [synthetic construct]